MRVFTVGLLLLFIVGTSAAQDEPQPINYSLASSVGAEADRVEAFFDAVNARLAAEELPLELVPIDWDSWTPQDAANGHILVFAAASGPVYRYIPGETPLAEVSPLLLEAPFPAVPMDAPHSHDLLIASLLYGVGRCGEAERILSRIADLSEAHQVFVTTLRGNCQIVLDDAATAAETLAPLVDDPLAVGDPDHLTAAVNLAWASLQSGDQPATFSILDALVSAERAKDSPASLAAALARRAAFHALAFNFDAAIADISAAIELDPDNPRYYKQRGDHIFLIYEWDRVLDDYNTAILLDPTYTDAYFTRGVLYYTQGPRPLALRDFERFIRLSPDDPRLPEAMRYVESIRAELDALGGDDTGAFGPSN